MLMMLAAPLAALAAVALPAPLSRFVGIAFLAIIVGLSWRAAIIGAIDLIVVLGGAALVRRSGFLKRIAAACAKRVAAAFMAFMAIEFGVFALIVASYTGDAIYALPFDVGFLLSGLAFAVLMSRDRKEGLARQSAGNFVAASSQASLACP